MKLTAIRFYLLLGYSMLCSVGNLNAQQTNTHIKIKPCLFKGHWQLVQTYSLGGLHPIRKSDYDGIICFRPFHKYFEEVIYESNHWIIEGKWRVNRKTKTLSLTERNYTTGKLEEHPHDIIFEIIELNKKSWAGSSTEKGQVVKVYYSKIARR